MHIKPLHIFIFLALTACLPAMASSYYAQFDLNGRQFSLMRVSSDENMAQALVMGSPAYRATFVDLNGDGAPDSYQLEADNMTIRQSLLIEGKFSKLEISRREATRIVTLFFDLNTKGNNYHLTKYSVRPAKTEFMTLVPTANVASTEAACTSSAPPLTSVAMQSAASVKDAIDTATALPLSTWVESSCSGQKEFAPYSQDLANAAVALSNSSVKGNNQFAACLIKTPELIHIGTEILFDLKRQVSANHHSPPPLIYCSASATGDEFSYLSKDSKKIYITPNILKQGMCTNNSSRMNIFMQAEFHELLHKEIDQSFEDYPKNENIINLITQCCSQNLKCDQMRTAVKTSSLMDNVKTVKVKNEHDKSYGFTDETLNTKPEESSSALRSFPSTTSQTVISSMAIDLAHPEKTAAELNRKAEDTIVLTKQYYQRAVAKIILPPAAAESAAPSQPAIHMAQAQPLQLQQPAVQVAVDEQSPRTVIGDAEQPKLNRTNGTSKSNPPTRQIASIQKPVGDKTEKDIANTSTTSSGAAASLAGTAATNSPGLISAGSSAPATSAARRAPGNTPNRSIASTDIASSLPKDLTGVLKNDYAKLRSQLKDLAFRRRLVRNRVQICDPQKNAIGSTEPQWTCDYSANNKPGFCHPATTGKCGR
jgi:hypothetical protein